MTPALISSQKFTITILRRSTSTSPTPPGAKKVIEVDFTSLSSLKQALQGQDAVVSTVSTMSASEQKILVDAMLATGVRRFIPSEFGSDLEDPAIRHFPIYAGKVELEDLLAQKVQEQAGGSKDGTFSYTNIYTNAFLDWGLSAGFVLDLKGRKARLYDGGDHVFTTTSLPTIARAVIGVLENPAETANRAVRIQDFATSLKNLVAICESATGQTFQTEVVQTDALIKQSEADLKAGKKEYTTFFSWLFKAAFGPGSNNHYEQNDNELFGIKGLSEGEVEDLIKVLDQQ